MRIAIVGSGISGMVAAYHLHREHEITVFEANQYIGGHTNTIDVNIGNRHYAVDTGFIVYNDWNYPNFHRLLSELGVETQPSEMSFSVKCENTGLEYKGKTLDSLFAQRSNLFKPSFHRMVRDILRFNREAPSLLNQNAKPVSIREYLDQNNYSKEFTDHFLIPMGAAIWSIDVDKFFDFPAKFFVRFFDSHGLLNVGNGPKWRVIKGGSREYARKLTAGFIDRVRLSSPVKTIRRFDSEVEIQTEGGEPERFDEVIIATHSDQALAMLEDPTDEECRVLGSIRYQKNTAVLHTDESILPERRKAWAAWNYHLSKEKPEDVPVTYNMNILQTIHSPETFCVTLNYYDSIDPEKIIRKINYSHPLLDTRAQEAQRLHQLISGEHNTHYCGAYWSAGFHEDGVKSALRVIKDIKRAAFI